MKRIVLLLLLYPAILKSQEPEKGNNAIIVKGTSFSKIKETLLDAGIFIDQQNAEDGTIITKKKGYCNCPIKDANKLVYYIRVKDSTATIRGKWEMEDEGDKSEFIDLIYWKAKSSLPHYLFGIMTDFAKSLHGSAIEYKTL